ncbi:MAG: hypothetical protein GXP58_06880 [Deltaproteobacteria bacterium]|nr:hypothetical protein [Deltaproteobacteria bacterium]
MIEVGVGSSIQADSLEAAQESARKAITESGMIRADFALLFVTPHHAGSYPEILEKISEITGAGHISGCSATGILTGEGEIENGPGVAVMAIHSDTLFGYPFLFHESTIGETTACHAIGELVREFKRRDEMLALFPDHASHHLPALIQCIEEELVSAAIIGGSPSSDTPSRESFQFYNGEASTHTLAGIYLTGEFTPTIGITQACHPVSGPLIVTRSEGNRIEELRGRPALEHLFQILQHPRTGRKRPQEFMIGLPADPADTELAAGNYTVRSITDTDPVKGAIITTEEIMEGRPLSFVAGDPERAREDLEEMAASLADRLLTNPPRFGLYINSRQRGGRFYSSKNIDIEIIRKHFGEIPLIGFSSDGEFAPIKGINNFHNHAGVLLLISDPVE